MAGDRLPSAPRERKPALAALAVLLVLLGALGTTLLVMNAGGRLEAVEITKHVPQGRPVPQSAIKSVMVAKDSDVRYVDWKQRSALHRYRASADLVPGSVLVPKMLSEGRGLRAGKVVVGLSLKAGQYPAGLRPGDTVAAYNSGSSANPKTGAGAGGSGSSSQEPIVSKATVQAVGGGGDQQYSGDKPVSVVVSETDAAPLTSAASANEVSLVITPGTGN